MKIKGKEVYGPNTMDVVFPRGNDLNDAIAFKLQAVVDLDEFERIAIAPEPPVIRDREAGLIKDYKDAGYLQQLANYDSLRFHYMVLKTLIPSEIEWSKVQFDKPNTWKMWASELKDSGFSVKEINILYDAVRQVNALDENMLEAARNHFLRGQAE